MDSVTYSKFPKALMGVDRRDSVIMAVGWEGECYLGKGLKLPSYNSEKQIMSKEQRGRETECKHFI